MADHTFTRCPGCTTVFRITAAQLALREGQVRCGYCRAVFDANDHLVPMDEPPRTGTAADQRAPIDDAAADEAQAGTAQADGPQAGEAQAGEAQAGAAQVDALRADEAQADQARANEAQAEEAQTQTEEAQAEEAQAEEAQAEEAQAEEAQAEEARDEEARDEEARDEEARDEQARDEEARDEPRAVAPSDDAAVAPGPIAASLERAGRPEWRPRKPLRERPRTFYGALIAALLAALAVQAVLEYRDALAAHAPVTRPVLEAACGLLGCTIGPLRDAAALSIDASDLQADPAHRGLLQLSATIRNRAPYPIAYPWLELTLTDSSDGIVVRRAIAPADYVGGTVDPAKGIVGNGERLVRLFIDASATAQAGYRLYLFYP